MAELVIVLLALGIAFVLAVKRAPLWAYALLVLAVTAVWATGLIHGEFEWPDLGVLSVLAWLPALALGALAIPAIRRSMLIEPAYTAVRKILPKVSETEQQALDAGTIGFDAEIFGGRPDWAKLRAIPGIELTEVERAFLNGPTDELCRLCNDWQIRHERKEIPEEIWAFVKKHGFLGMLISKEHGGLGFSPPRRVP